MNYPTAKDCIRNNVILKTPECKLQRLGMTRDKLGKKIWRPNHKFPMPYLDDLVPKMGGNSDKGQYYYGNHFDNKLALAAKKGKGKEN